MNDDWCPRVGTAIGLETQMHLIVNPIAVLPRRGLMLQTTAPEKKRAQDPVLSRLLGMKKARGEKRSSVRQQYGPSRWI